MVSWREEDGVGGRMGWRERSRKTRWGISGEIVGGWMVFGDGRGQ